MGCIKGALLWLPDCFDSRRAENRGDRFRSGDRPTHFGNVRCGNAAEEALAFTDEAANPASSHIAFGESGCMAARRDSRNAQARTLPWTRRLNRRKYIEAPGSNKRVSRPHPQNEWITVERPELWIVADELWNASQSQITGRADEFWFRPRGRNRTAAP